MKIAQIYQGRVHWITPYTWDNIPPFAPDIIFAEIPDDVPEGWDAARDENGVWSFTEAPPPEPLPAPPEPETEPADEYQQFYQEVIPILAGGESHE
jgi:hypothetical protein